MGKAMKVIVFGGTTEGRLLANKLADTGVATTLFVATQYGENLFPGEKDYTVIARRLDETEMVGYLNENRCDAVVDATHPFADIATGNIDRACRLTNTKYLRLSRTKSRENSKVSYVASAVDAVNLLQYESGNVFLAIGSKELAPFTRLKDFASRCHVRILPMPESLQKVIDLGFRNSNIICMQGPFDERMNAAMFDATDAEIIVTKDSGEIGGFGAKISAAMKCGCRVVVIQRPVEEAGLSVEEICEQLGIENRNENERKPVDTFFPLFFDIKGKRILIVGGGKVAARRSGILSSFGAQISVVSPNIVSELNDMFLRNEISYINRKYESGDVERFCPFLTIAATNDRETNALIAFEAKKNNVPVIVADCRNNCDCYFPAIAENETYSVGLISKNGNHRGVSIVAERIRGLLKDDTR